MNKLILLSSLFLTVWNATPQNDQRNNELGCTVVECIEPETVPVDQIVYIEDEEVIDLGFDVNDYLPENFDPFASEFEGEEWIDEADLEEVDLGFDPKVYLPKDFNAYAMTASIE